MLDKIYRLLCKIQDAVISVILSVMVGVVVLATVCRYFQIAVLSWPDELTRYLLIWLVFIGCGAASKNDAHFKITFLVDKAPYGFKLFMMAVRIVATNLLYLLLMYFSADLIGKLVKMGQVSPALHLPMWFMYLSVPVGCGLMLMQGVIKDCMTIVYIVRKHGKGES